MTVPKPLAILSVDHAKIRRNIARIRGQNSAKLMAVVKAEAFGHGAVQVARTALDAGAEWLGVATIEEGLKLRDAGITAPILAWIIDPWTPIRDGLRAGLTLSAANEQTLNEIADAAVELGLTVDVHLEIDSGMSRGGVTPDQWESLCKTAVRMQHEATLRVQGLWSHLANAGEPNWSAVEGQWKVFENAVERARAIGLTPAEIHLSNSAATFAHPSLALSMVRCGASMFGIETVSGGNFGLEYAARLTSRITQIRDVPAGTTVGYGNTWTAPKATRLGLVPMGYADGVPRHLSSRGFAVVRGVRVPMVGRVSMDQLVIDVADLDAQLGDEVVLLGDRTRGEPDPQEWSDLIDTISHEILTGFGPRVQRVHEATVPETV